MSLSKRWNLAAVAYALLVAVVLLVIPTGMTSEESVVSGGGERSSVQGTTRRTTLLETEGKGVVLILVVPSIVIGLPLLLGSGRAASAARFAVSGVLLILVLLGAMTIGVFFVPALGLMVGALATALPPQPPPPTGPPLTDAGGRLF